MVMESHYCLPLRVSGAPAAAGWRVVLLLLQQLVVCHLLLLMWGLCAWASAADWVTCQINSSTRYRIFDSHGHWLQTATLMVLLQ
jgi:hypothetical protein